LRHTVIKSTNHRDDLESHPQVRMAINIATVLSPATLDDNAWDDLLSFI
jgi:hypothetical protein